MVWRNPLTPNTHSITFPVRALIALYPDPTFAQALAASDQSALKRKTL